LNEKKKQEVVDQPEVGQMNLDDISTGEKIRERVENEKKGETWGGGSGPEGGGANRRLPRRGGRPEKRTDSKRNQTTRNLGIKYIIFEDFCPAGP